MSIFRNIFGSSAKDVTPLAENLYALTTVYLPYDHFWPNHEHDQNLSNRIYVSAVHLTHSLLSICIAVNFPAHWNESVSDKTWTVFDLNARKQWINKVLISDIVVWPDDRTELHRIINMRLRPIGLSELMDYRDSMGNIFSLLHPLRTATFRQCLDTIRSQMQTGGRSLSFGPENLELFATILSMMLFQEVHPPDRDDFEKNTDLSDGLLNLAAFIIGGVNDQCHRFFSK